MSSILKKLSVILCFLFGLVSINPIIFAEPGDYLVYFLGKDENSLICNGCGNSFRDMARMASCPYYCVLCYSGSIIDMTKTECGCYWRGKCCNGNYNSCHDLFVKYGPFCFINYGNGGDCDTVFKNAETNKQLYCLFCVLKSINDRWYGKLFSNIDDANFADCFKLKILKFNITNVVISRKQKPFQKCYCPIHSSEVESMCGLDSQM